MRMTVWSVFFSEEGDMGVAPEWVEWGVVVGARVDEGPQ